MSGPRHHWLTFLYPPAWRRRYGQEMDELLAGGCGWREMLDIARAALIERWYPAVRSEEEAMCTTGGTLFTLARRPSAAAPIVMSIGALGAVLVSIGISGSRPRADEDAFAHIWQLLIAGQLPILGWFAVQWLRKSPAYGLRIAGVQLVAFAAAILPVWFMGL